MAFVAAGALMACASDDADNDDDDGGSPSSSVTTGTGIGPGAGSGGSGTGAGTTTTGSGVGGGGTGGMAPDTVLLIPNSDNDSIGIYSPTDGTFIRDFLPPNVETDAHDFVVPIEAVQGPTGNIFVSDQIGDCVHEFEVDGTYVGRFVDEADGLDNVRGIAFDGADLLVSVAGGFGNPGGGGVLRFDASATLLETITANQDDDPYDVMITPGGELIISEIEADIVHNFSAGPTPVPIYSASFPQQVAVASNGNFLITAFSDGIVAEVTPTGTEVQTWDVTNPRGVYQLGNGNWLVTASGNSTDPAGIFEYDPAMGSIVNTVVAGDGHRFISEVQIP
ncbi:MAG: hypothetical protein AAF715_16335 [Myxococcota bacterium]